MRRQHRNYVSNNADSFLDQLRGLVLTKEEITSLLSNNGSDQYDQESLLKQNPELTQALQDITEQIDRKVEASEVQNVPLHLSLLASQFDLTPYEKQVLLVCLAPEIDRKYEKLYAYLQDDVTRQKPSVALILDLLCQSLPQQISFRGLFNSSSSLIRFNLVIMTDISADRPVPLLKRLLKLDDRITDYILGRQSLDSRLESCVKFISPQTKWEDVHISDEIKNQTRKFACSYFETEATKTKQSVRESIVCIHGPKGAGKRALAEAVCFELNIPMLVCNVDKLLNISGSYEELFALLGRETLLQQSALCLENFDSLLIEEDKNLNQISELIEAVQTFSTLTFILSSRPWRPKNSVVRQKYFDIFLPIPEERLRKEVWLRQFPDADLLVSDVDWELLAAKFTFTPGQIIDAARMARDAAVWTAFTRLSGDSRITEADLYKACRAQSNQRLSALAQKIAPKYIWQDIILSDDRMEQLREICNNVKYRTLVYQVWGFDRKLSLGKGLNVLFAGPSGTGKTMSAEIMANELGLDLYKVDLSSVVSKYIGETEKNLSRIFDEAETSNAILFFDEADALFGRRSEVRDSHDRYANIETGYLLQKMEECQGVVILATNFRKNMDDAFVRRLHFTVEFQFPSELDRLRIWQKVWPATTPVSADLNLEFIARRFEMTGGSIRNIALASAFLAASDGQIVTMSHLIHATRREYQKMGKVLMDGEFDEYSAMTARK